jgi:hypothetical protein
MTVIETLSSQRFLLNGIEYFKNYLSEVAGNKIRIYNAYDKCDVKLDWTSYGDIQLDGITFGSVGALQSALLPVIYTRLNLGTDGGFNSVNNRFIALGNITRSVNTFTFTSGFAWIINSSSYVTTTDTNLVVEEATEDNYRIDIVVANTLGELVLIQGEESEDVAVQPIVPANTLFLCSFNIFGDTIGDNSEPVLGLDFVKKIYYSEFQFIAPIDVISLPLAGMTGFIFEVGDFNIKGFSVENSVELYEGKEFSLKNNSNDVISLEHFNTNVDIWFNFFDEENSTLQPKEIKYFRLSKQRGLELKGSNLESTSTPTLQEVTEAGDETTVKTIFRQSETEWVEVGGDNNGIAVYNDVFGSLPTPKRIIDIAYNGIFINTYDTDTGEPTGAAGIGDKTLVAAEVAGGVQGKYTTIYPDRIIKGINGTTAFESFLPSENNDLNGSKVISTNTTAKNAINYLAVANLTMTDITPPSEGAFYEVTVINGTSTIGGVGYTAGQKVFRHFHSGSWRTFVYLDKSIIDTLLANKIDYLIRDFTFSSVTGVTTETLVESYEITAGKIGLNDFLNGFIYTTRTGLSGAYTVTLKANTVNNSSTATIIATLNSGSNFLPNIPMKFELTVKSGVIVGAIVDHTSGTNYRGQSSAINVSFDNSSNSVYLFLFVTPTNTSSVVQVQSFKLTK